MSATSSTTPRSSATTRPVPLVLGVLLALVAMPLLLGGLGLGWAVATQTDEDGYFSTTTERITTGGSALTSTVLELGQVGSDTWWIDHDIATVRVNAESLAGTDVFVGVAPSSDVAAYLAGTSYDEVTGVESNPFTYDLRRRGTEGTLSETPGEQTFWTASTEGDGSQELLWDVTPGTYTVVVMNADASAGVDVAVRIAGRFAFLTPIAVGLAVAGGVLLLVAAALIVYGARPGAPRDPSTTPPAQRAPAPVETEQPTPSPVSLTGFQDAPLSRGLWLVKWLLAIPHWIILGLLWMVYAVLTVVAFVAILVTGRYPRGLFDLNVGILRWTWRVQFYATSAIGTDRYPPFTLDHADYPADLDVAYPERLSRGLVLVKWWLLAIPQLIIVAILVGSYGGGDWDAPPVWVGGLVGALTFAAGLLLLFTGRYPTPLFDLNVGLNRWVFRVLAYVSLMTDDYPPFRLDQGPTEPGQQPALPPEPIPPEPTSAAPAAQERQHTGW